MRAAKVFLTAITLLAAVSAVAGELTPGLEAYLAQKRSDAPVTVLLVLSEQVDATAMDVDLHLQRTDLATRHFQVVTALQDLAHATQGPLLADLEARRGGGIERFEPYWLINAVRVSGTEEAIRAVTARADVAVAELDLVVELIEPVAVVDKDAPSRGVGITEGLVSIGARRVWDEIGIRGEGVIIGSLDTGVDGNHPALADRWRGNHAPVSECWRDLAGTGDALPTDHNSHGTHTTGTMAGLADDDTIGVAPAAEWIAVNTIDQGANPQFDSDVLASLQFFTDPDGDPGTLDDVPDVVQNSWRVNEDFAGYFDCDSRWWAAIDACEAAGVMLCWSAGNEGPGGETIGSPADRATTLYNCFSVGATSAGDPFGVAGFSSRGPAGPDCGPVENRTKPEIVAPGVNTYSSEPGGTYGFKSGTSMAGPHVAGVVALMRSANPNVDVLTIKQILIATARDLGQAGEDNNYGHGFVDAYEAVLAVIGGVGWVTGVVRDADTGLPLAGATVTVAETFHTRVTEADGAYAFLLPVGSATLEVQAYGYVDHAETVAITDGVTLDHDLLITALPVVRLSGTVHQAGTLPPDSAPLAGATVRVADVPNPAVITGADGGFEFFLPAGSDQLIQASLGGEGAISQIVPVHGDTEVDLYLGPPTFEGFETGDLSLLPWLSLGDVPWFAQDAESYEGDFAARSGDAGYNGDTILLLAMDCCDGGELSFWHRESSEEDIDYLLFTVDGTLNEGWSGLTDWAPHAVTVGPGFHTFSWEYQKNSNDAVGEDCAWIDAISLPGGGDAMPVAVVSPWVLDFGELAAGELATLPLVVMNQGRADLDAVVSGAAPWTSVADAAGTVAPREYHVAQVTVDATGLPEGQHSTWVHVDSNDPANPLLMVEVLLQVTDGVLPATDTPRGFALLGAVPNPFNPATTLRYILPTAGHVTMQLYDVQGRLIRVLLDETRPSGAGEVRWDGRDRQGRAMASGTYFARLRSAGRQDVKSLVLVR